MLYSLNLSKFKNLRIILTHKYLILVNKNGVVNLNTNFFNIFIDNNNLLFLNFNFYNFINNNLELYYINNNYLFLNNNNNKYLKYYLNYINSLYNILYNLYYNYTLSINLKGIGYKFVLENNILKIRVGYSHFINYPINKNILFIIKNTTTLTLYGNNKFLIKKIAADIKLCRKTNFYKGTGIFYDNEYITLKKKNNNKNKNAK